MKVFKLFISLVIFLGILSGCSTFGSLPTKNIADLEDPSFWDIGAGFAQLQNTDSKDDNDARGLMISFKAYPWGRWYSTEKPQVMVPLKKDGGSKNTGIKDSNEDADKWVRLDREARAISSGRQYVVCMGAGNCRNKWYNRLSMFYGLSSEKFVGGAVDSTVHAIGVGYDVTPEFALIAGVGFFDLKDDTRTDSDTSFLFGVSLNLRAVGAMLKASSN